MAKTEILPAETGRATYIKQRLEAINKSHSDLILENGYLLLEYKTGAYWKEDGYESFDQAIDKMQEDGKVDYGHRNAYHFIRIVLMIDKLGIEPGEIKALGVGKLRQIATLADTQQQMNLLEEAPDMTVGEVQAKVKALKDKAAGRETDPLDPVTLLMTETQKTFYKFCIERGRQLGAVPDEVPDVAVLIDVILADWNSGLPDAEHTRESEGSDSQTVG